MDTDGAETGTGVPDPGDPRDRGPRPTATIKDAGWGLLAGALIATTVVQFVGLAVALLRLPERASGTGLFLGFVVTVVWLLTIYWIAMGAWCRSVWGCPFQHTAAAAEPRRCPRHRLVDDDAGVRGPGAAVPEP